MTRRIFAAAILFMLTPSACALTGSPATDFPSPTSRPTSQPTLDLAELEISLGTLPAGYVLKLTEEQALAAALGAPVAGTDEVLHVSSGWGSPYESFPPGAMWVVVVQGDGSSYPGGPACSGPDCQPAVIVTDYAGAWVSDETGEVVGMFSRGHLATPQP